MVSNGANIPNIKRMTIGNTEFWRYGYQLVNINDLIIRLDQFPTMFKAVEYVRANYPAVYMYYCFSLKEYAEIYKFIEKCS